jgi:SapC
MARATSSRASVGEIAVSELPLFYRSLVPFDSQAHRDHKVGLPAEPYAYARGAHLLPALVDEFPASAREIAIVFVPAGTRVAAVFLCGLRPGANLMIAADGRWDGAYVPAYLRRYPFMLGERQGAEPILCFDPAGEAVGTAVKGERLFDETGNRTPALDGMIKLVTDFAQAARRTEAFTAALVEHDLLKPITIDVRKGSDPAAQSIHGMSVVDEQKLAALSDDAYLALRKPGFIAAIYAHLLSLGAMQALGARQDAKAAPAAA